MMEVLPWLLLLLLLGLFYAQWRKGGVDNRSFLDEIERMRRSAEQEGKALLEDARREAERVLSTAKEESKSLLEAARRELEQARQEARELRQKAEAEADRLRREAERQVKAQLTEERARLERELARERERLEREWEALRRERDELKRQDERLARRGEQLDARAERLDQLEEKLEAESRRLRAVEESLAARAREVELKLEEVAGMTREEAKALLLKRLDEELEEEKAIRVKAAMERARLEAKKQAQHLIAQAVQRQASETAAALAVSVVPIPSDAMKGRIIGREGRNIRTFEALTGVDLIIDDTPEAVILSSFNPLRREIARMALEQLVADGRIHPSRIEEVVERAKEEMKHFIYERGEEAALEAGVVGLKPGLVQLLGRMHFRSSYGQNVLKHSIQVAHLTGILAAELGLDPGLARRCGLLHDIGKSVDREIEGTHVEIGIALAKRFGEPDEVIDAIAHHHDPENAKTLYAVLVAAADAISAARPGARRESLEEYIKRLEQLEAIASSFPGVEQAFAVQAGREVRVIVKPDKITDAKATLLAHEIAQRIERDMDYPGQVQVTVVRETRVVDYAR
ncbi:ribonuclease Y [Marinithermus hydrothermalis]|uniref:Ribonuclease Y n=1 Tax=Marinithermus hydrothermalis (strain DSM 14884 / JCM 11576 / T1) TaxID=869210 RepID=F2NPZ1_MARHT|nr:2,3 cyclic-nucleotide 2-phosphodiesterase [Marinithermus hydrothermalis DSM 14884]